MNPDWRERAAEAHRALWDNYARTGKGRGLFAAYERQTESSHFHYWWHAHALEALVDAHRRDPSPLRRDRIAALIAGVRRANGGHITNHYYDDMAWMGIALLRADTCGPSVAPLARNLWGEIREAWNPGFGGGIPWRRSQPGYKNVAANAPAAILAARLHRRFHQPGDLDWARRIMEWLHATLIDPRTGIVWDGINRRGDGRIDSRWIFSYNFGTVIGADLELAERTGDSAYRQRALGTAEVALDTLSHGGVLPDEGHDNAPLFKGIFFRYLAMIDEPFAREALLRNGRAAWQHRNADGLFGPDWRHKPTGPVPLSGHLGGLILMERLAAMRRSH